MFPRSRHSWLCFPSYGYILLYHPCCRRNPPNSASVGRNTHPLDAFRRLATAPTLTTYSAMLDRASLLQKATEPVLDRSVPSDWRNTSTKSGVPDMGGIVVLKKEYSRNDSPVRALVSHPTPFPVNTRYASHTLAAPGLP